jgi:hypothetical protein
MDKSYFKTRGGLVVFEVCVKVQKVERRRQCGRICQCLKPNVRSISDIMQDVMMPMK